MGHLEHLVGLDLLERLVPWEQQDSPDLKDAQEAQDSLELQAALETKAFRV